MPLQIISFHLQDADVTQEKARVANLAPNGINESAVVIRDLTKVKIM